MTDLFWHIEPLHVPDSLTSHDAADFVAAAEMANIVSGLIWGNNDHWVSAQARLAAARPGACGHSKYFVARDGAKIIGLVTLELPLTDNTASGYVDLLVHPHYRRRGVGSALCRAVEALLTAQGRRTLLAWTDQPANFALDAADVVRPRTGYGSLPRAGSTVAFARHCGYELEQVERFSMLSLPVDPRVAATAQRQAASSAGPDYEVLSWADRCPDELVEQYAHLRHRMSLDIPLGELQWEEEVWDRARVREGEERLLAKGGRSSVAAVRHVGEGRLVGHTIVEIFRQNPGVLFQEDTLVLSSHRGHRLGVLLKAHNLLQLQRYWPSGRRLYTWNAAENEHMLNINVALGFKPAGYTGAWQKKLRLD